MNHLVRRALSVAGFLLQLVPGVRRVRREALNGGPADLFERLLHLLGVRVEVAADARAAIPRFGPLVIAVNHPTGILDGLVAAVVARQVRPDVRILANLVLTGFAEARQVCCFVDPFGWKGSTRRSYRGLSTARRWLARGGALVIFPAGEVGHVGPDGAAHDPAWKPTAGRLILASGAAVAVMHLDARPSRTLRWADRVHRTARMLMLVSEPLRQRGACVHVTVAAVRAATDAGTSAVEVTTRLRAVLDGLARGPRRTVARAPLRPVAAAAPKARLRADVERLDPSCRLLSGGSLSAFLATAGDLPHVLDEIGRLRELAFRDAGEGTGQPRDLDGFDETYHHLFVWNHDTQEIAGAYRVGDVDRLTRTAGVHGLYSRTLFAYDDRLLGHLGPALELGRSFVCLEYQRQHAPLLLLWQGIGRIVARAPQHRVLFGLVSISSRYASTTRRLLMEFLRANHLDPALAELVEPRFSLPPVLRSGDGPELFTARTLDDVCRLTRQIERDGRDVPVLLRQYLKLNARLLGFNVDPAFGDALDGFLMVDLTEVDRRILNRFLGRSEASRFLALHAEQRSERDRHERSAASRHVGDAVGVG